MNVKALFFEIVALISLLITEPKLFFKKLKRLIVILISYGITPKETKIFIKHNKVNWGKWLVKSPKSEILLDSFSIPEWIIANSYFVNVLAKKHNSKIKTFSGRGHENPLEKEVHKSFNIIGHVYPNLNKEQKKRKDKLNREALSRIKTKKNLYELNLLGVWIGIDIYETYLKRGHPTIDFKDQNLWDVVDQGIELLIFWQDYFKSNKVAAVILSHDCYNNLNIFAKVAYQNNVSVYLPNARGIQLSDEPHATYKSRFWNYPKFFQKLSSSDQKEAIQWAKTRLERRFKGEVGVNMAYSTASAFRSITSEKPVLSESSKTKVLICTHCFYDNPHAYGGMLFLDFYEWLCFLGELSEKTDYDWYVKTHPDYLPGTIETLNEIIRKYPKMSLVPAETSFHRLIKEGISFALTCYGSIGHELPALGIQVINAGYNPHIGYDFNWHPKSMEEYEHLLLNLDKLSKKVEMQELYAFYYVNYNYAYVDDLIYTSHRQMGKDLTPEEQIGPEAYGYFLNQLTEAKHQEIIANMEKFIDSGKRNYFSLGPE